jgi:hypothetical protein
MLHDREELFGLWLKLMGALDRGESLVPSGNIKL